MSRTHLRKDLKETGEWAYTQNACAVNTNDVGRGKSYCAPPSEFKKSLSDRYGNCCKSCKKIFAEYEAQQINHVPNTNLG